MNFYFSPEWMIRLCLLWVGWAVVCWLNVYFFLRRLRKSGEKEGLPLDSTFVPFAVVIEAVKGVDKGFDKQIDRLLIQDYPAYRIIFVVESKEDPAWSLLLKKFGVQETQGPSIRVLPPDNPSLALVSSTGLTSVEIMVAGLAEGTGQKVHNLLQAFNRLEDSDKVLAFVDADTLVNRDWLSQLVQPLKDPDVGVTTGYRWLVPGDGALPSCMASVINASIATLLGPSWRNSAWGGSMAVTRRTFEEAKIADFLKGSYNEDSQLSWVIMNRRQRIHFVNRLMPINEVKYTWSSFLNFGRRQYFLIKWYRFDLWMAAAFLTSGYLLGWVLSLILLLKGNLWGLVFMSIVFFFDLLRANARIAVVHELFDSSIVDRLRPVFLLERWSTPLWFAVHALIVWSVAFSRHMTFAGIRYKVEGRQQTQILSRK
jgi:cellulose synthase/poly-beta-1,6-N-acetylglucosamine synthase-like glycosyltransferase